MGLSAGWLEAPVECGAAAGFGLYLHVPFCHHRCGYCDFATAAIGGVDPAEVEVLLDRYLAALRTDLVRQVSPGFWPALTSVFIGGGTPTLLGGARLAALLDTVRAHLEVADDVEVTVEANPETVGPDLLAALSAAGVTRLSMGAQSLVPQVLTTLERGHGPDRPAQAVAEARAAGIAEVSLDLIYGTPGERDQDWLATLAGVATLPVDHLSAYALTLHANTPFGREVAAGRMPAPDDDVQRERFEAAREVLGAAGFEAYEVSNFARATRRVGANGAPAPARSRHNLLYWRHGDYLGVGVGAHGHHAGRRWWSTRSTSAYLTAVEAGASPVTGEEHLDVSERALERLLLGLRVREGLHPGDLPPIDPLALEDAVAAGLVEIACGRLRCTRDGWFLLDEAVERLTA